jgi:hypothetical protein
MILAGIFLVLVVPFAAGREDEPEKVSLADLKTGILRKMVAAHAAAFAADKAHVVKAKSLADHLGGAAGIAGKLAYAYPDNKPLVELDATKLEKDISLADREAALAAVKDLLTYSLNKVTEGGITEGGKTLTLAGADAKALAGAVRIRWRAGPPPPDTGKALAARLDALMKELEALKKVEARIAKIEKDAPAAGKRVDDLAAEVKKAAESAKELGKLAPAVQKLEKGLEKLPAQLKALTDRVAKQDKAIADSAAALEKQSKELAALKKQNDDYAAALKKQADATAALKKQSDDNAAALEKQGKANLALKKQVDDATTALDKQGKEMLAALKKQSDDNAAALERQSKANVTNLAKQKQEMAVALDKQSKANSVTLAKQGEANLAAMKKAGEQSAKERKRLAALEDKFAKEGADWKKINERLERIEAILFPPPPPVVPCEVAEQGTYMMTTSWRRGCFGRLFPSKTRIWVPCPIPVPCPTTVP